MRTGSPWISLLDIWFLKTWQPKTAENMTCFVVNYIITRFRCSISKLLILCFCISSTAMVSIPAVSRLTENLIECKTPVNLTCDIDSFLSQVWWEMANFWCLGSDSAPLTPTVLSIGPVDRTDTETFPCNISNDFSFDTAKCRLQVYCKNFNFALLCHNTVSNIYKVKE